MENKYSILNFGAVPNGDGLQTEAFQKAIDAAFLAGGGEVTVPAGKYIVGSLRLRSNVIFHLLENAEIYGSRNPLDYFGYKNDTLEPIDKNDITDALYVYPSRRDQENVWDCSWDFMRKPGSRWNNAILRAHNAENITVIGEKGSLISGSNCYDAVGEEEYRGPHGITVYGCTNILLKGYTVRDTGNWAHNIRNSSGITLKNVTVYAGHDGFHATACSNMLIQDCEFYTGDDCIAGTCLLNLTVKRCVMNSACSAMRLGGRNIYISACKCYGPGRYIFRGSLTKEEKEQCVSLPADYDDGIHRRNMLSFFTYYSDKSYTDETGPGNIYITDCVVENSDRLLHYNFSGNEPWQCGASLSDITLKNITAENLVLPVTAYGDRDNPLRMYMNNVKIKLSKEYTKDYLIQCAFFQELYCENVEIKNPQRLKYFSQSWSGGEPVLHNCNPKFTDDNICRNAENEPFECNAI